WSCRARRCLALESPWPKRAEPRPAWFCLRRRVLPVRRYECSRWRTAPCLLLVIPVYCVHCKQNGGGRTIRCGVTKEPNELHCERSVDRTDKTDAGMLSSH